MEAIINNSYLVPRLERILLPFSKESMVLLLV